MRCSAGFLALLTTLVACVVHADRRPPKPDEIPEGPTPKEVDLGKRYSTELEKDKEFKLVKDEARTRQLNELARDICAASGRPKFEYVVKLIEDRNPNAFTLPGGYIYFTTGLLDFVRSDHELAAVMAHEIAHNARMHQIKMSNRENRLMWVDLLTMAGAMLAASGQASEANRTGDYGKVVAPILFKDAVMKGLINRYSIAYEREADTFAFDYLVKTKRNPVGLLTFMERLNEMERRRPTFDPGVYMTHPTTKARVEAANERLRQLGIPVQRSAVTAGPKPRVQPLEVAQGGAAQVLVGDLPLFKLAGKTETEALQRANETATRFHAAVLKGLRGYDLRKTDDATGVFLMAGREFLVAIQPRDVALNQTASADELAQRWIDAAKRLLLRGTIGG